jgi:hypothetical protein
MTKPPPRTERTTQIKGPDRALCPIRPFSFSSDLAISFRLVRCFLFFTFLDFLNESHSVINRVAYLVDDVGMDPRAGERLQCPTLPNEAKTVRPDRDFYLDPMFMLSLNRDSPDDPVPPTDNPPPFAAPAFVVERAPVSDLQFVTFLTTRS